MPTGIRRFRDICGFPGIIQMAERRRMPAAASFALPCDFRVEPFAAEPDLAHPVAFAIDERG